MQIGRLFEMVYILLGKEQVTASEMAEKLEVSKRTVYRYLDVLSQAGIPVYASRGRGGGIRLMEGFVLDKGLLSSQEQQEILSALQGLGAADSSGAGEVLQKISGLFRQEAHSWISVDFSYWGDLQRSAFDLLKQAVLEKNLVEFQYFGTDGRESTRTVEPLQLWFKSNRWYLKAWCRNKEDFRLFKLTRIQHLIKLAQTFQRDWQDSDFAYSDPPGQVMLLKLRLHPSLAYRVYDEFHPGDVQKDDEGYFLAQTSYIADDWVLGYVFSFGSGVEVLEPAYFRELCRQHLLETLQQYESKE